MAGALRRSRGEAADEPLGPSAAFGLGAAAGAVSAVSIEGIGGTPVFVRVPISIRVHSSDPD